MPTMRHKPTVQKMTKSLQHANNTTALAFRRRYDFRVGENGWLDDRLIGKDTGSLLNTVRASYRAV